MKNMKIITNTTAIMCLFLFATAFSDGLDEPHPNYDRTDIMPNGENFLVGGLGMFSNGDLAVCNWGNPGDVWILEGAATGGRGSHNARKHAYGLQQSLGCEVVNDRVYVMEMGALTELVDIDGNGVADEYLRYNDNFATSESLLGYSFGLAYYGGSFYTSLASDVGWGGSNVEPEMEGKSRFLRLAANNETETIASGFRNPDGLTRGFGNQFFGADNQGVWIPASKINHLQKGKFYGHFMSVGNEFQIGTGSTGDPYERPMVWLPHGEVSRNPGGLDFIKNGLFANQLLFAELTGGDMRRIYRISVEEVGGVYQGTVHPFAGGFSDGTSRIEITDDGTIFVGLLGSGGGWDRVNSMGAGLYRFSPNNDNPVFEILRVRSTGSNEIELDFTQPVNSAGGQSGNYSIETWTYRPTSDYGGPKRDEHGLNVSNVTLSNSNKTANLTINGLEEGYVVRINLNGSINSSTGQDAWGSVAWFTLNKFGPGNIPATGGCMDAGSPEYNPDATVNDPAGCTSITAAKPLERQPRGIRNIQYTGSSLELMAVNLTTTVNLYAIDGRVVWSEKISNAYNISIPTDGLTKGMYILSYKHQGHMFRQRVAIY